jgi:acyl carrier protein
VNGEILMKKLLEILSNVRPDIDFSTTRNLIDDGILDSFDIVMLVGELNQEFEIRIGVENLIPENFNSANAIMALINRLQSS